MKLKTKLLLGVGSTLIAATPIAILASCSKVDAPTKAPTAVNTSGYMSKDGNNGTATHTASSAVTSTNAALTITSSTMNNKFFTVTLPTTYKTAFSTTGTSFSDNATVAWTIKSSQNNANKFSLTGNTLKSTMELSTGTQLVLVATITESGKQTQTVDVSFTFNIKTTA